MPSSARRTYIDWARGIAVLLMVEAHTIDAWTRLADKKGSLYGWSTIFGGFAAPMFLWLAGLGVVFSASRTLARTGSRTEAVRGACERGLEIFLLAFLFRLQAFVVSPGSHPITLFRVDVLNIMGPAMVAAGLVYALRVGTAAQVLIYSVLAASVALVTPIVRAASWVGTLPLWLQWYIRPAAEYTTFTLFPWAGFVFGGAAVGAMIAATRDQTYERRALAALALAGAVTIGVGFYTASLPTIYDVPSAFWTSSPTFFAIRIGVLMVALATLGWIGQVVLDACWQAPLAHVGRASLFIYWIHVELVYGYASWLWRHRLPLWFWPIAYVAFSVFLYRAIGWRDNWLRTWRQRPVAARTPVGMSS